jgi:hypothetical protein
MQNGFLISDAFYPVDKVHRIPYARVVAFSFI